MHLTCIIRHLLLLSSVRVIFAPTSTYHHCITSYRIRMGKKSKRRQAKKSKKASSGDSIVGQDDDINSKCKHECFEYLKGLVFGLTDDIAKIV